MQIHQKSKANLNWLPWLVSALCLFVPLQLSAEIDILGINLQYSSGNSVQVILTAERRFDFKTFRLGGDANANKLPRFVLDAYDTNPQFWLGDEFQRFFEQDNLLSKVRVGKNKLDRDRRKFTRIVIDLRRADLNSNIDELVSANGNFQLILQFTDANLNNQSSSGVDQLLKSAQSEVKTNQQQKASQLSSLQTNTGGAKAGEESIQALQQADQLIVIIDPGHGGRDPGALSPDKEIMEKDITTAISSRLFNLLQQDELFLPKLTRDSDTLISLKNRLRQVHNSGAHMFISIHADSFPWSSTVRGSSVYVLADEKNADQLANLIAENENAVDERFGLGDINEVGDDVEFIARDLQVQSVANASQQLARNLIDSLANFRPMFNRRINQGPFYVLRSAYTPSVLVEVGFISNEDEAKELIMPATQQRIAMSLYEGIKNYAVTNMGMVIDPSSRPSRSIAEDCSHSSTEFPSRSGW